VDAYKIGVSIALANGVSPVLAIITKDLLALNAPISKIEQAFSGWKTALLGVAAIGTAAVVEGLIKIAEHGGEVNHQLEMMKLAGMSNADIQQSMAQAMQTSGSVLTTTLSENLKHIRELRYAFGDTTTAMAHMDEISKANSVLNSVKGGGKDEVWELVKSLEGKGLTYDPAEFSSYVNTMTKVIEASGGKVTPQMFMSTFKYGRTSTLGWSEEFVGGALPRLIQSMASSGGGGGSGNGGPGNALMSAFAKIVQGQMPKTAAEEFARLGLGTAKHIEGSAESQIEGGIKGRDLFIKNPYEWVQQVLMPALTAKGITSDQDIIAEISKLMPVRTASQIISEMALQGRAHEGERSPFEKDIRLQQGAMGLPGYDELIKNDYPTILKAFNQQWTNLLETLGSPLMAPGGPAIKALAGLTDALGGMAQFAGTHLDQMTGFFHVIEQVGSLFVKMDIWAAQKLGAITGVTAVFEALGKIPWESIAGGLASFNTEIAKLADGISSFFNKTKGLFGGGSSPKDGFGKDLDEGNKNYVPMRFMPGNNQNKAQPLSLSLNVDGRTLAEVISDKLDSLYRYDTTSPAFNGTSRYGV
jgi:hypothetical protein